MPTHFAVYVCEVKWWKTSSGLRELQRVSSRLKGACTEYKADNSMGRKEKSMEMNGDEEIMRVSVVKIASSGRWCAVSCVRVSSTFTICDSKRTWIC